MTTTEALRAAATKLREMAEAATPGPWAVSADRLETHLDLRLVACADDKGDITDWLQSGDAHLIATLGPTFAGFVADWLDDTATGEDWLAAQLAPGLTPYVPAAARLDATQGCPPRAWGGSAPNRPRPRAGALEPGERGHG